MDAALCDELLQEIFIRLPPPASATVPLVSKRWLRLYRSSKSHLSLRFHPHTSAPHILSSFLSHFPFLSSLSLNAAASTAVSNSSFADHLVLSAASSFPNLRHLRLLTGPVSPFPLFSLSTSCPHLTSLSISLSRPLSFHWLLLFRSLKELAISFIPNSPELDFNHFNSNSQRSEASNRNFDAVLQLETLAFSCIRHDDYGLDWLWRSCKKLKKLQLRSCEGIGDDPSLSSFIKCIKGLQEVELRTCRTIVDDVLLKLAENCKSLKSLLVYDGGSREGLLQFITQSQCDLRKLDLRLPLDLDNSHLIAVAENFRKLSSLRLQSCCLVTGEGLKTIGLATSLEELALINCDVVEREPGLLTTLGQSLKQLRKLDLSHNEMLVDKEFTSMLASCGQLLSELKLRGCKGLSNAALISMLKSCKNLESVDIMNCCRIEAKAVELFVRNSPILRQFKVEENKLSGAAKVWASD